MIDVVVPLAEAAQQTSQGTWPGWGQLVVMAIVGLCSGFAGGWMVAFRLGNWRQKVESWLKGHDKDIKRIDDRLGSGKVKLDRVPTLKVQLNAIKDTIDDIKQELQYQRDNYVHQRECQKHQEESDGEQD